jgi:hypothetical protein
MPSDPTGYAGPHPDLRALYCEGFSEHREQLSGGRPDVAAALAGLRAADLNVRCQRTWYGVRSFNEALDGGDYSASIVQFAAGDRHFSFLVEATRSAGEEAWVWRGASGGQQPREALDAAGGFSIAGGSYACMGGLAGPGAGFAAVQIEHADGTLYSAEIATDGCVMVFAPVVSQPSPTDEVILRYLDAQGTILHENRIWIGDGNPPPRDMGPDVTD